jgi:GNAT superfamily N-acetyltransferase
MQWQHDDYLLVDETSRMDLDAITAMLRTTYWAASRTREVIAKTIQHSLTFGLFHAGRQVGFARVVTDRATVGYLCDVIIAPEHRGHGLGKWILQIILEHPDLQGCRIDLFTKDAQEFYRQFGFGPHPFTNLVRYPPNYTGGGANRATGN